MLDAVLSNRFKKDLKTVAKRGYNLELLDMVVDKLANQVQLEEKYKDHALSGDYSDSESVILNPTGCLFIE